ncbi:MAG: carboxypeptidase-like regulatory domain-containing protein [Bacteroidia bacterium]
MKNLIRIFLSLILVNLITLSVSAKEVKPSLAEKGAIRGKVVEEVGALVVPFAGVAVYEATLDQVLFTTQTDENGYFKFTNLKPGTYKVKVSYVGFTILFINDIILTEKDFDKTPQESL